MSHHSSHPLPLTVTSLALPGVAWPHQLFPYAFTGFFWGVWGCYFSPGPLHCLLIGLVPWSTLAIKRDKRGSVGMDKQQHGEEGDGRRKMATVLQLPLHKLHGEGVVLELTEPVESK